MKTTSHGFPIFFFKVKSQRCKEIRRYLELLLLISPLSCAKQAAAVGVAFLLPQGTKKSHFPGVFLLPHAIMEPEGWFFLHLEDLVWCIPELFVLIIQSKEVVAQRGHSWHKNKQMDESPGSSAHPHPKTQMNKANIGSWKETDTGISLEQILGRKGWGGAVTLVQPKALGWIKQIFLVFKKFSNPHLAQGLSFKEITLNFHFVQVTEMGVLPTSPLRSQLYFIDKFNPQEVKWGFSKGAESFAHSTEGILVSMGWSAWALHWLHPRAVLCSRPLELPAPALGAAAHLWDHSPKRAASTGAC